MTFCLQSTGGRVAISATLVPGPASQTKDFQGSTCIYLEDIVIFGDLLEEIEQTVEAARQHFHQWNNPVNEWKSAPSSRMLAFLRIEVSKSGPSATGGVTTAWNLQLPLNAT